MKLIVIDMQKALMDDELYDLYGLIGNITLDKCPLDIRTLVTKRVKFIDTILLQRHIVVGIHIINTHDGSILQITEKTLH